MAFNIVNIKPCIEIQNQQNCNLTQILKCSRIIYIAPLRRYQLIGALCFGLYQGSSISGPRAKSGPRRPHNWPAEQLQNSEEIYYIFFKIYLSVLTIYVFLFIINERLILVKFSSVMQDAA